MNYEEQYVLAIVKLISHSGLKFLQILSLKKENFDFENMCINAPRDKTSHLRKATIRPDDVQFFKKWMEEESDVLFSFSERTYRYSLARFNIPSPVVLRNELKKQMQSLHAKTGLIATKLGYYISYTDEQSSLFEGLKEFEQKHFGDNPGGMK